jgi:hypothetical protein
MTTLQTSGSSTTSEWRSTDEAGYGCLNRHILHLIEDQTAQQYGFESSVQGNVCRASHIPEHWTRAVEKLWRLAKLPDNWDTYHGRPEMFR